LKDLFLLSFLINNFLLLFYIFELLDFDLEFTLNIEPIFSLNSGDIEEIDKLGIDKLTLLLFIKIIFSVFLSKNLIFSLL
jgi:hypothetical protein